jgi:hypothetical protein
VANRHCLHLCKTPISPGSVQASVCQRTVSLCWAVYRRRPLSIFQNHCRISRTHPENPFSLCSVHSMKLNASPLLTRRAL